MRSNRRRVCRVASVLVLVASVGARSPLIPAGAPDTRTSGRSPSVRGIPVGPCPYTPAGDASAEGAEVAGGRSFGWRSKFSGSSSRVFRGGPIGKQAGLSTLCYGAGVERHRSHMTDTSGPTSRSGDSTVKGDPRRHLQVKVDVEGLAPVADMKTSRGADLCRERPVPRVPGESLVFLFRTPAGPWEAPCSGRCPCCLRASPVP